jgi:hypothetical protein
MGMPGRSCHHWWRPEEPHAPRLAKQTYVSGVCSAVYNRRLLEIIIGDGNDCRQSAVIAWNEAGDIRVVSDAGLVSDGLLLIAAGGPPDPGG